MPCSHIYENADFSPETKYFFCSGFTGITLYHFSMRYFGKVYTQGRAYNENYTGNRAGYGRCISSPVTVEVEDPMNVSE